MVADGRDREFIDRVLVQEQALWPEPMMQVSPSYARAASVDDLAERGALPEFLELNERAEST
jgi:hypothetical protein